MSGVCNKIGNDQKITGKPHIVYDFKLRIEPVSVFPDHILRQLTCLRFLLGEPFREPAAGLFGRQFI